MQQTEPLVVDQLDVEVRPIGQALADSLREMIDAIPGAPHRPTALARRVGVNRVIASKLLNAIDRPDPYAVLQHIPGPDSLRVITRAATQLDVPTHNVKRANEAIESFSTVIRRFGTRGALNAAISPHSSGAQQQQFEHSSRYHVYKGMRQILGVEADTWLTSMFFTPSDEDRQFLEVTTMHGALSMRRLRSDVKVYFTFGPPYPAPDTTPEAMKSPFGLEEFYTNAPATLDSHVANGMLVHRLASEMLGRQSAVDMLAVSHNPRGSRRYAAPDRSRGGVAIFVDIPVKTLICDAIMPKEVFPDSDGELIVYNPGARGPANPNDPQRDIDRITVPERIERLGYAPDRFDLAEVPRYADMVTHVCTQMGRAPDEFRVYRLRMAYPINNFQHVLAFEAPLP